MYEVHRGMSPYSNYSVNLHHRKVAARSISAEDVTGHSWFLFLGESSQDEHHLEYVREKPGLRI
jgi:hypothetical protein